MIVYGNSMYVFGGNNKFFLNDLWKFDFGKNNDFLLSLVSYLPCFSFPYQDTLLWTKLENCTSDPNKPCRRMGHTAVVYEEHMYARLYLTQHSSDPFAI